MKSKESKSVRKYFALYCVIASTVVEGVSKRSVQFFETENDAVAYRDSFSKDFDILSAVYKCNFRLIP